MKKSLTTTFLVIFAISFSYAQITKINSNKSLSVVAPLNDIKTIFYSDTDNTLWVSEGTPGSTIQLSPTIEFGEAGWMIGEKLVFSGFTEATGTELFITDGTPGGTVLVKDIKAGTESSTPDEFVFMNGFVYFSAETEAEGRELWRSNGTTAGTTLVKDINPGTASYHKFYDYDIIVNGNYILLAAEGSTGGLELWKSDGTSAGTIMLKDINPGADSSDPGDFNLLNGVVIFSAKTAANGREYWRSDGTPAGTFLLKDINPGPSGSAEITFGPGLTYSFDFGFFVFNGRGYFQAFDGTNFGNIYGTDGSVENTTLLKTVVPGITLTYFPAIFLYNAIGLPGRFIFSVADEATGGFLWQSDGTPAGTTVFKSFDMPGGYEVPFLMPDFSLRSFNYTPALFQGNKFFFAAATNATGYELWISDGTLPGTNLVKDINPNSSNGIESPDYIYTSEALYFAANNNEDGIELWRSDGTNAGTALVKDIWPNAPDSDPEMMIINNGKVFFGANDGDNPDEWDLFVLDGTVSALPAKLGSFFVQAVGADAVVQWQTIQEVNTSHFTIQRSTDGTQFENRGTVQAAGTVSGKRQYSFTDEKIVFPAEGYLYYRLVTNDKDGKKEYSRVVRLKNRANTWQVKILGNTVGGNVTLAFSGVNGAMQMNIHDISGRQVFNQKFGEVQAQTVLPVQNLPKGIYTLTVWYENERKTLRFVR